MGKPPEEGRGRVTGIGGVFFRAKARDELARWYGAVLGLPVTDAGTAKMGETVWAAFDADTAYFPATQTHMVNYIVDDVDAVLLRLREAGMPVASEVEEDEYGRFAWGEDPEGNRFELWQPGPEG